MSIQPYESFYYGYQVVGRGLTTVDDLRANFERRVHHYDELFGSTLTALSAYPAVDVGCGYGNFLYFLNERGWADARGVDLDPRQIELARSLGLTAERADAIAVLRDGSDIGLVSAFDVIEHLDKNDAVTLLLTAYGALREGGALVIQCPCADGFRGAHDLCNDLTHRWAPTSVVLNQMLMAAGFSRVELVDLSMPPHPKRVVSRIKFGVRRLARRLVSPLLLVLGVGIPRIWSNSVVAVAWKDA